MVKLLQNDVNEQVVKLGIIKPLRKKVAKKLLSFVRTARKKKPRYKHEYYARHLDIKTWHQLLGNAALIKKNIKEGENILSKAIKAKECVIGNDNHKGWFNIEKGGKQRYHGEERPCCECRYCCHCDVDESQEYYEIISVHWDKHIYVRHVYTETYSILNSDGYDKCLDATKNCFVEVVVKKKEKEKDYTEEFKEKLEKDALEIIRRMLIDKSLKCTEDCIKNNTN